jgi:hypothetical protein
MRPSGLTMGSSDTAVRAAPKPMPCGTISWVGSAACLKTTLAGCWARERACCPGTRTSHSHSRPRAGKRREQACTSCAARTSHCAGTRCCKEAGATCSLVHDVPFSTRRLLPASARSSTCAAHAPHARHTSGLRSNPASEKYARARRGEARWRAACRCLDQHTSGSAACW